MAKSFEKYRLRNVEFTNRMVMSPMCMYSAKDGLLNDFHQTHYLTRAIGGVGLIIMEATAVSPEGRISPEDLGIWNEQQKELFLQLIQKIKSTTTCKMGIQLAHAGRKASNRSGKQLLPNQEGWQTIAPSAIPFLEDELSPIEMNVEDIKKIVSDFASAAKRSVDAGFDVIEIHAAHGYLLHQFLSPYTNKRNDEYGGNMGNRCRFLLEVVDAIQKELSQEQALMVRISATDYIDNAWDLEQSIQLSQILKQKGVDMVDVSSGGNVHNAVIKPQPLYQVEFANQIKKQAQIDTGAVGLITTLSEMETILSEEKADLIFLGRELLRNPYYPIQCAFAADENIALPSASYQRAKPSISK